MKTIHDPAARQDLINRVNKITADSKRQWGAMTPDQMLKHLNKALASPLGDLDAWPAFKGLRRAIIKRLVLSPLPFPKGKAQTYPEFRADGTYNIPEEQAKFTTQIERFARMGMNGDFVESPGFGKLSGEEYGRLLYKHADHHLRQFGV
jgi:hypothetical protein